MIIIQPCPEMGQPRTMNQLEDPRFVEALRLLGNVHGWDELSTKDVLGLTASLFRYYTLRLKDDDKCK
jgi:hypothetical protein